MDAEPDPLLGWQNDSLRFESILGRGGMGAVYQGVQLRMERPVAIKVIRPDLAADPVYIERFMREAQTLGKLVHPHVISCHDFGPIDGPDGRRIYVMVLEYVDGWSLGRLQKERRLSVRQVLDLYVQACIGLHAAHRLGVVHRDIKPDNIMVTRQGQAKLSDFGLARAQDSVQLTQTGAILGSPAYMAPEACRGDEPGAAADIYSLGCSLFQSLVARTPFEAGSTLQMLHLHGTAKPPRLGEIRPDLAACDGLVERCLAKRPAERWPDAGQLAAAIKAASSAMDAKVMAGPAPQPVPVGLDTRGVTEVTGAPGARPGTPTRPTMTAPPGPKPRHPATPGRSRRPLAIAAGAVALVLIAGIGIALARARPGGPPPPDAASAQAVAAASDHLDQGRLDDAARLLAGLPESARQGPLSAQVAACEQRLRQLRQKIKDEAQQRAAGEALARAEGLAAAGDFDRAGAAIEGLHGLDTALTQRRERLLASIAEGWRRREGELGAALDGVQRQLDRGDAAGALAAASAISVPERFAVLAGRRDALLRACRSASSSAPAAAVAADPAPAAPAAVPVVDRPAELPTAAAPPPDARQQPVQLTVLRGSMISAGPQPLGHSLMPGRQPASDAVEAWLSASSQARDTQAIHVRLPPPPAGGWSGIALLLHGNGARREIAVRASGATLPAITLQGGDWEFAVIDLAAAPTLREFYLAGTGGAPFLVLRAVAASGRLPQWEDLDSAPGTLQSFVTVDAYRAFSLMVSRVLSCHRGAIAWDATRICLSSAVQLRWRLDEALVGCVGRGLSRPDSAPVRLGKGDVREYQEDTAGSLESCAKDGQLAVLTFGTDHPPCTRAQLVIQAAEALVGRGVLPVVVLTSGGPAGRSQAEWRPWEQELRRALPGLPIIDLADVQDDWRRMSGKNPPEGLSLQRVTGLGLEAGLRELRLRVDQIQRQAHSEPAPQNPPAGERPRIRPEGPRPPPGPRAR